jgi:tetratricopeptide (TPR) repeat protein
MVSIRSLLILLSLAMALLALPALAQEKVAARSGAHKGYTRLVFEWPEKPVYSISKEGGRILVRFSKAGSIDKSGVSAGDKNIRAVETLSAEKEPLQVAITIPDGSRFRDFVVENKMVVDVYDSASTKTAGAVKAPEPEKEIAKEPPAKEEPPAKPPEKEKAKGDFSITPAQTQQPAPIHAVEASKVAAPALAPHTITMTTTFSVGVAAYVRAGNLWIVTDTPDLPAQPKIEGPQKETFGAFEKMDVAGGAAFMLPIPEGMHVYGEGGGLSWKIILTPVARKTSPAIPVAEIKDGQGQLVWPMQGMRKVLSVPDTVVGDTVVAVTSGNARQYSGAGRNFVDLQSVDSAIGLAFVPRTDGLKTDLTTQQVIVTSGGGLKLSGTTAAPARAETMPPGGLEEPEDKADDAEEENPPEEKHEGEKHKGETPAEDMALTETPPEAGEGHEHEEAAPVPAISTQDMSKAAGEKPPGNNIYNFPRWEMGGLQALDKNQHIMMTDVSAKPDESRAEDIITMAKMNIANNRAPEALGLLRVALQKVPELEGNTEFQSLRAAALALSGKNDEAIQDFSRPELAGYDDIKYWRAYVLAGLEDWKQAGEVMPKDFTPIYAYPKDIRTSLLLTFSEVALRNGNVPVAQGILKTLAPELEKMPLWDASAYKYLKGEAQRQSGNTQDAEALWTPLVKDGKDDLYRAKAGLSLTKLQLDEKKIKPAEAIDRLEGLRYAWRGDELETLVNFRLGQVYLDNKDYLKGLTVWRNASSFSPGTQIAQDMKLAMGKNFRDVFANDRLKDIPPLEAISLYEEFKDLTPPGDEGNRVVEKLAERLVDADLLGRAAVLLEYHVNNRLTGGKKAGIAIRLAAIRLLDGNPDGALRSLELAEDALDKVDAGTAQPAPAPADAAKTEDAKAEEAKAEKAAFAGAAKADPEKRRQIDLLRARALSMKKKPDEALAILEDMRLDPDVNRLRTDIAWTSGKWEEAAMALNDLIVAEDISPKMPLTDYQRDIILNRAIALNLSGNRVALANLRERYNGQMKGTTKGKMFEIVTRPRRPDMIGSREAIASMISEIDLFSGFLDSYAKMQEKGKPDAPKEPAAVKEPVPVDGKKPVEAEKPPETEKSAEAENPVTKPQEKAAE